MKMWRVLLIVAGLIALCACSLVRSDGAAVQHPDGTDPTVITLWTFLDPESNSPRDKALRLIIDEFERENPSIRIKVETHEWSTLAAKFLVASSSGNAPDISFINTSGLGGLLKTGAGADLNALFINRWPEEEQQDFFVRKSWDAALVDGKRYAVPIIHGSQSLFYRKDLFRQAGIDAHSLKTWDQFIEAAKKLTKRGPDGSVEVWGFGFPLIVEKGDTTAFLYSLIELQQDIFTGSKPNYANEAGVRSLQLQASFITEHETTPKAAITYSADDIVEQFIEGKYAIILGPFARYPNIYESADWGGENLGILRMPNWTDERFGPAILKGWWAAVSEISPHKEEAAKFVEHMISRPSQLLWGKVGGQIPTRASIYRDEEFRKPKYAYMKNLIESLEDWSWLNPVDLNMTGYEDDIAYATQKYLLGNTDPLTVLKEAEQKFMARQ